MKNCQYCNKPIEDTIETCPLCNNITPEIIPEKKHIPIFSLRELFVILGFWIFLGLAHNYLMFRLEDGISIPIFALLFLVSLYSIARILKITLNKNMFVVWGAIFIFSLFRAVRVGSMLTFFNTVAIYFTSFLLLTLVVKQHFENIRLENYFFWFIKIVLGSFAGIGIWIKDFTSMWVKPVATEKNLHILKGVLMAIPLIFVFTLLFASADLVFQTFLNNLFAFKVIDLINASERLINIVFFSIVFIGVLTFISYAVRTSQKQEETETVIDDKKHIEINIMLSFVALLFLIFIVVQIGYLFGGEQMILSGGHTYADYATRGFQELSIIALIVFVLFWKIDHYLYAHKKPSNSLAYKWLASLIVCFTILILFSAFHRLWLYETTYGYTETRFYGYVFIIILGFSLIITLYKILEFFKEWHFLISILSLYGLALLVCNIISPESFIAESNTIKTYRGSLRMDSSYIGGRSEDAVDNMLKTYNTLALDKKKDMNLQFCNMIARLKKEYSWQEWNYSRLHAWEVLSMRERDFNCSENKKSILR
jgi:hypothetical protein